MTSIAEASALRLTLVRMGYTPLPLFAKVPAMKKWQEVANVSREMIAMWARTWPSARNTGILTRYTPALDLDIYSEPAAIACEDFVRERCEERGPILVRIGKPPKRLIVFRTLDPFPKITANFIGERVEKVELLASGQQFAGHGVHPDTGQAYRWHGGEPWTIAHNDLPYLHPDEAQQLVADVVKILTTEFGYQRVRSPPHRGPTIGNGRAVGNNDGAAAAGGEDAWQHNIANIIVGNSLHDSIRDLAGMLVASGMTAGAATHLLAALVELSEVPHDARWDARYRDVPRAIDSAVQKFR
jgi:hypothetical protein